MSDLAVDIRRLAVTIHELMSRSDYGWISWKQVARHQTGSAEASDLLSSMACLPEWKHLFVMTQSKVKLSDEGLQFVRGSDKEQQNLPGMIADAVVSYARSLRPIILDIQGVSLVAKVNNKIVHAVIVELSDEVLPTETPVQIHCANGRYVSGKLVGQESDGDVLYVACDTDITPAQQPTKLIIDRAYLLTQLADQLRSLNAVPDRLLAVFDQSPQRLIANADSVLVADQLATLPTPWTRFLWGPPGAGKTFGLGHLVARLIKSHPSESVLIVAPSNRAVDVAVSHLITRLEANSLNRLIGDRKILRFGYPRNAVVLALSEILGPANLDELSRRVNQIARKIAAVEREEKRQSELAVLRAELLAAQEAVKDAVREHVAQCSIVATTTTLAYMPKSPVAARMWDTVIVDEVTMVPPAMCAFLASRAKKRLLMAGDPCQLGPVFEDRGASEPNTEFWLKRDVFVMGGVSSGHLSPDAIKTSDGRLARISAQRRCAPGIWNHISHLYPQVGNSADPQRLRDVASLPPLSGASVAFVDLSKRDAKCEQMRRSWQNVGSAEVAMQVVATLAANAPSDYRIAIICPYRAQVKLLRQWIRDEQKLDDSPIGNARVEVGTVHQFQGSEADAVVFDMVDGPGRKNLGLLLRGETGTRLVNVAISRARGKLVVLADREWCRSTQISLHNRLLSDLVFGGVATKTVLPRDLRPFKVKQLVSARFDG